MGEPQSSHLPFDDAKLHFHYSNHGLSILICIKGAFVLLARIVFFPV